MACLFAKASLQQCSDGRTFAVLQGIKIQENGKAVLYSCGLCNAVMYSDHTLSDHINGKRHARQFVAKAAQLQGSVEAALPDDGRQSGSGEANRGSLRSRSTPPKRAAVVPINTNLDRGAEGTMENGASYEGRADLQEGREGEVMPAKAANKKRGRLSSTKAAAGAPSQSPKAKRKPKADAPLPKAELVKALRPVANGKASKIKQGAVDGGGTPETSGHISFSLPSNRQPGSFPHEALPNLQMDQTGAMRSSTPGQACMHSGGKLMFALITFDFDDTVGRGGNWQSKSTSNSVEDGTTDITVLSPPLERVTELEGARTLPCTPDAEPPTASGDDADTRMQEGVPARPVQSAQPSAGEGDAALAPDQLTAREPGDGLPKQPAVTGGCDTIGRPGSQELAIELFSEKRAAKVVARSAGRSKAMPAERSCFICRQLLVKGAEVAALWNTRTGRIACSTRNHTGVFHVFHSRCLADWVALCQAKAFSALYPDARPPLESAARVQHPAGAENSGEPPVPPLSDEVVEGDGPGALTEVSASTFHSRQVDGRSLNSGAVLADLQPLEGPICPECQGTGVLPVAGGLERPRYRLAQIYDCIMELVQTRKTWSEQADGMVAAASSTTTPCISLSNAKQQQVLESTLLLASRPPLCQVIQEVHKTLEKFKAGSQRLLTAFPTSVICGTSVKDHSKVQV
eukprot:SM000206S06258  [mRNA]  locus=s206:153708:157075:+ [translate_table: standard]